MKRSLLVASVVIATAAAGATELRVSAVDAAGKPVALEKAQVILTMWGDTQRIDLPIEGNRIVVPLDKEWPLAYMPQVDYANLYFEPRGGVPVLSEPFGWIGQSTHIKGRESEKAEAAAIVFQSGASVRVAPGEAKELRLVARKPEERWIRLVDPEGRPLPEVQVTFRMYWTSSCHTGVMMGSEALGEATSNREGLVPVPDGDIEYGFTIQTPHYAFRKPRLNAGEFRNEATMRLTKRETTVPLLAFKPRKLAVEVVGPDGKPAAGAVLRGSMFSYAAVASPMSGPVASADAEGRIEVEVFYPDEHGRLFFTDAEYQTIWELDPADLPEEGPLRVELDAAPLVKERLPS